MTYQDNFTLQPEIMEQITGQGLEYLPELIRLIVNAAMKVERQRHLGAAPYERNEERKAAGERRSKYGLIFTTKTGTPINYRNLLRDFKLLLKNAGLPSIRFHDLRHTAASLMLNHGIPVIVVSRRLGHAKSSITLDVYGHLFPSIQVEAAQKIDDLITPIELNTQNQLHPSAPNCTRSASAEDLIEPLPPYIERR
jgi:integrase